MGQRVKYSGADHDAGRDRAGEYPEVGPGGMHRRATRLVLYAAFAATGACCALPGVLLPWLLRERHWQDRQGGRLFLLIALGSAVGPLLVSLRAQRAAIIGCLLFALASAGWSLHNSPMQILGIVWGLGLGMTTTAITLLGQRHIDDGRDVLTRLNFLWALGACTCPLLASYVSALSSPAFMLRGVALLFGAVCLCLSALLPMKPQAADETLAGGASAWQFGYWDPRGIPFGLLVATALATGIEASGGAWLATYAARAQHWHAITVAAPSAFWAGLLCSRALSWFTYTWLHERRWLRALLIITLASAGSLLLPFQSILLLLSSFALGFGLGPLYPEILARVLQFRQTSLIFFICGLTSALMPWGTGLVSTRAGSLHVGLLVPGMGALVMLLSGWSAPSRFRAG